MDSYDDKATQSNQEEDREEPNSYEHCGPAQGRHSRPCILNERCRIGNRGNVQPKGACRLDDPIDRAIEPTAQRKASDEENDRYDG